MIFLFVLSHALYLNKNMKMNSFKYCHCVDTEITQKFRRPIWFRRSCAIFLKKRYLHCLKNCGIIVGENPIKKLTILFLLTECRSALKSSPQLKKNLHQQIATNILKLEKFIENSLKREKSNFLENYF